MRIIGGTHRGRKIAWPDFDSARPTQDRIRQAVFNVLGDCVEGRRVLDLFSGSGAYGLEALSRGAKEAVFVEKDRRCIKIIKDNISTIGVEGSTKVYGADVFSEIEKLHKNNESFDIVFADPPYNMDMAKKILITISRCDILSRPALVVLEHHRDEKIPDTEGVLSMLKQKTYKDTYVSLYLAK